MENRLHREPVRLRTGILIPGAHDPDHRDRRQAERVSDRRRRVAGCAGGQDRPVTIPPRVLHQAGLQRAAFPVGQPAPDAVRDRVAEGVLQARLADRAPRADPPRGPGCLAALGEEQVKVSAAARSPRVQSNDRAGLSTALRTLWVSRLPRLTSVPVAATASRAPTASHAIASRPLTPPTAHQGFGRL